MYLLLIAQKVFSRRKPSLDFPVSIQYINLARAKSEALDNIYSLFKQNIKLHVQHSFFVHFFAVVLYDYNVKLPETS